MIVEIAFALHGWPGLARYMFEAAGVMIVLAGVFVGRVLADPPRLGGVTGAVATAAGAVAVGLLVIGLLPPALSAARVEHKDIHVQRARTIEMGKLNSVIAQLGGAARLRGCGEPLTRLEYQTALAYTLGVNVSKIGFKYGAGDRPRQPDRDVHADLGRMVGPGRPPGLGVLQDVAAAALSPAGVSACR